MSTPQPVEATGAFAVRLHDGPASFLERARDFLLGAEAEHNLLLGLAGGMAARGERPEDAFFATVEHHGGVVGCAFRTPPEKLLLTRLPTAAVPPLVSALAARYASLPAVLATEEVGGAFAAAWSQLHGVAAAPGMRQGIYQLTRVIEPTAPAAGSMRQAVAADEPLIAAWLEAFGRDADHPIPDPHAVARVRIARGVFWLWEDGGPVCLAGRMGRTPHGDRIGFVFTPAERRGRGYASTLVARLSAQVLAEGLRYCSLYTDLSNATSNGIYQRLGYRLIAEVRDYVFPPPG